MEIDYFSGKPAPVSPRDFNAVNRPDRLQFARIHAALGSQEQVKAKESDSVEVSKANHRPRVSSVNHKVVFDIDPESKDVVIKLFNEATGEEIRQIPAEDVLRLSERINEFQEKLLG